MRARMLSRARVLLLAGMLLGLVSACGVSSSNLPLPSAGVSGPSYRLTAIFSDALNLPEGAHVKQGGDDIGRVQQISLENYHARVTMRLRADVSLPAGTTAELRQATPLGEIFVAVHPPAHPVAGPPLHDGDVLGLPQTQPGASIEDLLSAFSMVINGGGLAQTQTIAHELNVGLDGRTGQTVHLMAQSRQLLATLNANTANIDHALAATKSLTGTLNDREPTLNNALANLPPAIGLFADQTDNFTRTLTSTARAGDTAGRFLDSGGDDIRGIARDLGPVTDGFRDLRPILGPTLNGLVRFGAFAYQRTDGDSIAGPGGITLSDLIELPGTSGRLPGPEDLVAGEQGVAQTLERMFSTEGGTRSRIGGSR